MNKKIKFVYFDIGGVMFHWKGILHTLSQKHNRTYEEVHQIFLKYDELSCRGFITPKKLWQGMQQDLKLKVDDNFDFLNFAVENFKPIYQTHQLVKELIPYLPIGILSNIHLGFYNLCLKRGHLPNIHYSVVIESCKIGLIKPEEAIFLHAQKKAQVEAGEILFIDDSEKNISAARKYGWQAILFETDQPVKSIKEIKKVLISHSDYAS